MEGAYDNFNENLPLPLGSTLHRRRAVTQFAHAFLAHIAAQLLVWGVEQIYHQQCVERAKGAVFVKGRNPPAQLQVVLEKDGQVASAFHLPHQIVDGPVVEVLGKGQFFAQVAGLLATHKGG